jgi:hypothetical protein
MERNARHLAVYQAAQAAGLEDMISCRWALLDMDAVDTVTMLREVCIDDAPEREGLELYAAISLLAAGHAPDYSTPWPDAARALLKRRNLSDLADATPTPDWQSLAVTLQQAEHELAVLIHDVVPAIVSPDRRDRLVLALQRVARATAAIRSAAATTPSPAGRADS